MNFSTAVNDLVFVITHSEKTENFIFNSNAGTVSITGNSCYLNVSGKSVSASGIYGYEVPDVIGGYFKISAPSPYTQLTINGTGGYNGSEIALSGASIVDPLPISLIDFSANAKSNTVMLSWITATESNNKGFEVERSTDTKNWTNLGFVNTKADNGNSNMKLSYEFTDAKPAQGVNYYRLKQVEIDSRFTYSIIRSLNFDAIGAIHIYPNPANQVLTIDGVSKGQTMVVYNSIGQQVNRMVIDNDGKVSFDVSNLSGGLYYITLLSENGNVQSLKFVKAK